MEAEHEAVAVVRAHGGALLPPIHKHEDVVGANAKHEEDGQNVQLRVERDAEDDAVDEEGNRKAHHDLGHGWVQRQRNAGGWCQHTSMHHSGTPSVASVAP